jgi:CRP-like cAMP-binding protein
MILPIERVMILKSVSIFSSTPVEYLANVADVLEEIEIREGETIIEKGDLGRSLYIIVYGQVYMHKGERFLAILGSREVFGEWAALDPEPRAASAKALTDCLLFRLEYDALYELMEADVEVVQGIIHILCKRLRSIANTAISNKK